MIRTRFWVSLLSELKLPKTELNVKKKKGKIRGIFSIPPGENLTGSFCRFRTRSAQIRIHRAIRVRVEGIREET